MGILETIIQAGRERKLLWMRAREKDGSVEERIVEPYSFRPQGTYERFYCYDVRKQGTRQFYLYNTWRLGSLKSPLPRDGQWSFKLVGSCTPQPATIGVGTDCPHVQAGPCRNGRDWKGEPGRGVSAGAFGMVKNIAKGGFLVDSFAVQYTCQIYEVMGVASLEARNP